MKIGNERCWYGFEHEPLNLFQFVAGGLDENQNLLRYWICKERRFGVRNWGDGRIGQVTITKYNCFKQHARYCGFDESVNNAWARQTYNERESLLVTLGLGELMLSEERVQSGSRLLKMLFAVWF